MKILLTGFEPFGGETVNPAQEAVQLVKDEIKGAQIVKCYVPVVFGKAIETVHEAMKKENPDVVLCIGQAGGRYEITPERVAINCDDGRIPDNEGNQPVDQPVFADGENAYFSTLPVKKMVEYMKNANVPAAISNSAGTYVCNHQHCHSLCQCESCNISKCTPCVLENSNHQNNDYIFHCIN